MANTGTVITTTLQDVVPPCPGNCTPLGNTKENLESDPDYIAPEIDTSLCPVSYTTTCPVLVATGGTGRVTYEASMVNSVTMNPAIKGVRIQAVHDSLGVQNTSNYNFPLSGVNYLIAEVFVPEGTYSFNGFYYDFSDSIIETCNDLDTGIIVI